MLRRLLKTAVWTLALAWLAGCVWLATDLPPVPRAGWQPPAGMWLGGFLGDSPWLIGIERHLTKDSEYECKGPIRRWNVETGEEVKLGLEGVPLRYAIQLPRTRLIRVEGAFVRATDNSGRPVRLWLIDGMTGATAWTAEVDHNDSSPFWTFDEQGRLIAYQVFENGEYRVRLHDARTGAKLHEFPGAEGYLLFSPDGSLLVTCQATKEHKKSAVLVFDTKTGAKVAELPAKDRRVHTKEVYPRLVSRDNTKLMDTASDVYDLKEQCLLYSKDKRRGYFSEDSRFLIRAENGAEGTWLAWYDIRTGDELPQRRVPIDSAPAERASVWPATDDGGLLRVVISHTWQKPFPDSLFDSYPWAWTYWPGQRAERRFPTDEMLMEADTHKVIFRLRDVSPIVHPAGKLVLAVDTREPRRVLLYDLPAACPWLKAGGLALLGVAPILLIARRRFRRTQPAQAAIPAK